MSSKKGINIATALGELGSGIEITIAIFVIETLAKQFFGVLIGTIIALLIAIARAKA